MCFSSRWHKIRPFAQVRAADFGASNFNRFGTKQNEGRGTVSFAKNLQGTISGVWILMCDVTNGMLVAVLYRTPSLCRARRDRREG